MVAGTQGRISPLDSNRHLGHGGIYCPDQADVFERISLQKKSPMKIMQRLLVVLSLCLPTALWSANFNVTTPGFSFTINGQSNPTLTLTRGMTYTFGITNASGHPFRIASNFSTRQAFTNGVVNNGIFSGLITFAVPTNAPNTLFYVCPNHGFGGTFNIVNPVPPADFNVTAAFADSFYRFNGSGIDNPAITLTCGLTYTFDIDTTSAHPFQIVLDNNTGESYDDGVVNNNISSGRITFTVPTNAPSTLYYICSAHGFGGTINIVNPPPPPLANVRVFSISIGSNSVTLKSKGTNGWITVPEFSSNLLSDSWAAVPNFTNVFANGTNTTSFNRLEPICGPNVFLRIRNTPN